MFFIPKHIEYNYYHYSFIRKTLAQNTIIALSVMWSKGSHLGFYIDIMVVFQNYRQKCIPRPQIPQSRGTSYDCSAERSILILRPFQLICSFTPCACTQYVHKNLPKMTKAATKLNLLIYPPTIKLLWLYLYKNNTSTNAKIAHSVMQVKGSHLGYYIDSMVNPKIYCQKWIPHPKIP